MGRPVTPSTSDGSVRGHAGKPDPLLGNGAIRRWAVTVAVAHFVFVAAWLIAPSWQGPDYSPLAHSISDMYAVGAPNAAFLLIVITLCGATALLFIFFSLLPMLRPAGWPAAVGAIFLGLSVVGIGDLLTPFERLACRLADPGCSSADQLENFGGRLDSTLTTVGLIVLIAAGFFIAEAMRRLPVWRSWAWPARWTASALLVLLVCTAIGPANLGGLFERLVAGLAAAGLIALAAGVLTRTRRP